MPQPLGRARLAWLWWEKPGAASVHLGAGGVGQVTQLAPEVQVSGEVHAVIILSTGLHTNGANALLTCLHCQVVCPPCSTTLLPV